jgi:hypothetical protein
MVHRLDWIPANIDDGSDILMLNSISKLIKTFEIPDCPVCMKEKIRFYYTISDFQPDFVTKKGQVRGTVWVWCPNCLHWTHGSHIHLSRDTTYINQLDESELKQAKGRYMIDNLNRLWNKGRLSASFTVL